jgi:NADPH-dependent 2,4-dienoyl-CoA reductase/sulfur reductase-like enzyme
MPTSRRDVLAASAGWLAGAALGARAATARAAGAKVVVVGGGYGGATAAKYIRKLSRGTIDVVLVEREEAFVSCPMSNLVIGGSRELAEVIVAYDGLDRLGVRRVRDEAVAIDSVARRVRLAGGESLAYDRLVLSPGIDFMWEAIPSLGDPEARKRIPHAWQAGTQTMTLRRQLEAMRDGGVFVIHIPTMPYRCAPAPYERACQVAFYFSIRKPRSKVIVLDANAEVQSKKAIFTAAWNERYKGIVEYRPESELADVDASTLTAKLVFENVRADVLNVIPPQCAGAIARQMGMANSNGRFCMVDFLTYESTVQPGIHVLGDAIQTAPLMAKAGHMANRQAKICAAAVVALLAGDEVNASPSIENLCYSFVDDRRAAHIASVHRYDPATKTMLAVAGRTEISAAASIEDGADAQAWARNIWADMLS